MLFARLDIPVSSEALKQELKTLPESGWIPHVNRQDYDGDWDVLPLRCHAEHKDAHPILQGFAIHSGDDWVDLPLLSQLPNIASVLKQLQCPLKSARLMRLHAGAEIKPHTDNGLAIEFGEARLPLCIESNRQLEFRINNQPVPMQEGELWYVNVDQSHQVNNKGNQDRINLVVDCVANQWLQQTIQASSLCGRTNNEYPSSSRT